MRSEDMMDMIADAYGPIALGEILFWILYGLTLMAIAAIKWIYYAGRRVFHKCMAYYAKENTVINT